MKKIIISTIACIMLSYSGSLYAQLYVGTSGGLTINTLSTSTGYRKDTRYDSRNGVSLGIPIRYSFNKWLAAGTEVSYIQKNYRWERTAKMTGPYQNVSNSYLNLPVMANISLGGRLKGFANIGWYWSYWMDSRSNGRNIDIVKPQLSNENPALPTNQNYVFNNQRDNRWETGALLGLGAEYSLSNKVKAFTEIRYYYSISDMQKQYMYNQIPRYNNTFVIQLGVMFNLCGTKEKKTNE